MSIKNHLKPVAYWTLPPGIKNTILEIYQNIIIRKTDPYLTEIKSLAKKNSLFKNKHHGERCFILATGPSITEQDLSLLKGELCIAVSSFFMHKDIKKINPQYHVIPPNHPPFTFDKYYHYFKGFNNYYSDEMIYFFGYRPYKFSVLNFLKQYPEEKIKNIYFLNYCLSKQLNKINYKQSNIWDICKCPFGVRTVIYTAIQIAFYMGCKQIYLLGCDHDYLNNTSQITNRHFYKDEDTVSDVEHLKGVTQERWFQGYYHLWLEYRLMREYLNLNGCQIYNATKGGMLDVFPRVEFANIF